MRSVWLLALAASGCRSLLGIEEPARGDAGADGFAACTTWHPEGFDPCALAIVITSLTLDGAEYVYDSGTGALYDTAHQAVLQSTQTLTQTHGPPIAVLSIGRLTILPATRLSVIGARPLLIVSWSSIAIDGAIDAGSHLGVTNPQAHIVQTVQFGAGANQNCVADAGQDGGDAAPNGGSGGGGGGGFQGTGGQGGRGGGASGVPGGAGGQPTATATAAILRGGCPGGTSGVAGTIATPPASRGSRATGGAGGGAIRLVAHDAIEMRGTISANGAGGAGAPTNSACGGGGGGGGGYVGFEAPLVRIDGTVTANGGGGGGGGSSTGIGNEGSDGVVRAAPAPGGTPAASGCGQAGAGGAAGAALDGSAAASSDTCSGGGGGGGGASGVIVVTSPTYLPGAATLSPAAQVR